MIATPDQRIVIGAMSGTSADGVDVAITDIAGQGLHMAARLRLHHHRPYTPQLRQRLFTLRSAGQATLADLAQLASEIALTYAAAVNEALRRSTLRADHIAAIAAHGQTLYHAPPLTLQWIDPALLAYETGCPVITDFRRADCAAGGQGAPLVPLADYLLFRHPTRPRVLLNLGGIANLTLLPAGATPDQVLAFDTGPANCISDHLCRSHDPAGPGYDPNGQRALQGQVHQPLLRQLLAHPYFARPLPKSTDAPEMIAHFTRCLASLPAAPPLDDLLATAAAFTAETVHRAIPFTGDYELIASGGGAHNSAVMGMLGVALGTNRVVKSDALGVPGEAKEALAFALLGAATLDNLPGNLPSATGARRPVVLGCLTPRP